MAEENRNSRHGKHDGSGRKNPYGSGAENSGRRAYDSANETADGDKTKIYDGKSIAKAAAAADKKKKRKMRTWVRVLIIILAVLLAAGGTLAVLYSIYVKPPEKTPTTNTPETSQESSASSSGEQAESDNQVQVPTTGRKDGVYTFALIGTDQVGANTDTIMIVKFDTSNHSMNVVSIPRDTLVNVSWSTKKINSLYGNKGMDGLLDGLKDVLGFKVDFYVLVDLNAFKTLVNEIGGVWYDVPTDMNYEDPTQDLYIHVSQGYQCLNGEDAMGVVRFRRYVDGDIKRISIQQDFLKAAFKQLMENKSSISISTLAQVFIDDVTTDLTYGNLVWMAQEFFKMDINSVQFMTMPGNYTDSVYGGSYVTIYTDKWLEMINTYLNPFNEQITLDDQNILTRNTTTGKLYSTTGNYAGDPDWGN